MAFTEPRVSFDEMVHLGCEVLQAQSWFGTRGLGHTRQPFFAEDGVLVKVNGMERLGGAAFYTWRSLSLILVTYTEVAFFDLPCRRIVLRTLGRAGSDTAVAAGTPS